MSRGKQSLTVININASLFFSGTDTVPILTSTFSSADVGVDIILDCVGATHWEKNLQCLNTDGRWILYGLMGSGEIHGDFLTTLLRKRGNLLASTLRSRSSKASEHIVWMMRVHSLLNTTIDLQYVLFRDWMLLMCLMGFCLHQICFSPYASQ